MTTVFPSSRTCAVCHKETEFRVMGSTSSGGGGVVGRLLPHPAITAEISRVLRFQKHLVSRFDVDAYTCEQAFAAIPQDNPTLQH